MHQTAFPDGCHPIFQGIRPSHPKVQSCPRKTHISCIPKLVNRESISGSNPWFSVTPTAKKHVTAKRISTSLGSLLVSQHLGLVDNHLRVGSAQANLQIHLRGRTERHGLRRPATPRAARWCRVARSGRSSLTSGDGRCTCLAGVRAGAAPEHLGGGPNGSAKRSGPPYLMPNVLWISRNEFGRRRSVLGD